MAKSTVKRIRSQQMEYMTDIHPDFSVALDMLIERDKLYSAFSLSDIRRVMREELTNNGGHKHDKSL